MAIETDQAPVLVDAIYPLLDALDQAEIRWCLSMRDIDPPTVFVPLPTLAFRFKESNFRADYRLVLIVPNTERRLAIDALSELLDRVQRALGFRAESATPVEVALADNSAVVLAYEIPFAEILLTR